jgi:predicted amidohydrolase
MKVSIVQFKPKLGNVNYNIKKTEEFVRECIKQKSEICLFPELSLTGYNLQDLTFETSLNPKDERLSSLLEMSKEIGIIVGLIEETEEHLFFNSAFYLKDGKVVHIHRKLFLPTYGMFDEGRFVGKGERVEVFKTPYGKASILICEDLWHFSSVYLSFIQGAKFIFAQSASPGRGYREKGMFGNSEVWKNMGEFYSRLTGSYFIFANRVGTEDGFVFSGNSFISNPYGEIIAEASPFSEEIITVKLEPSLIRSARINLPMLRDERPYLVKREIERIMKNE